MQQDEIKRAIHVLGNGVFVVSAEDKGEIRGFTATWVSQVSYQHRLIMVSASKEHDTYRLIEGSGRYVVNILGISNVDLARHFGRRKAPGEPLDLSYFRQEHGKTLPVLKDAMGYIRCQVISQLEVMDHTIFVGQIEEAHVLREENPLLYYPKKGYLTKYDV